MFAKIKFFLTALAFVSCVSVFAEDTAIPHTPVPEQKKEDIKGAIVAPTAEQEKELKQQLEDATDAKKTKAPKMKGAKKKLKKKKEQKTN